MSYSRAFGSAVDTTGGEFVKVIKGHKIETDFVYPPIPDRNYDWQATFSGYDEGDLIGRGPTEVSAIADLLQQAEEQGDD